jgi:hypothetical protein
VAQIHAAVEEALRGPLVLAERYERYIHLMAIPTEEFVEDFEASDSSAFADITDDPFVMRFLKYRAKVSFAAARHDALQGFRRALQERHVSG